MNLSQSTNLGYFEGYASIFGEQDLSGDTIKQGAFQKTLIPAHTSNIRMLYQHSIEKPIGYWTDIFETTKGLFARGYIILETSLGYDVWKLIKRGALNGLSIGFQAERAQKKMNGREITQICLWEISIVTFPMAPGARIKKIGYDPVERLKKTTRELNRSGV